WPGNVRELENVICRSLVPETADDLQTATLPAELVPPGVTAATTGPREANDERPPPGTLADVECGAIAAALDRSGHNLTRAATALGIDRTTLHRKLKKYGLRGSRA
ncbi:MAG: sigma-54-dependent Fis family transcriptional regulator, partial [Acidobacteria bacterium]|nr:sigma-54-dependent Fis family transcriptional regulator [Acidobacteriota bacterium]